MQLIYICLHGQCLKFDHEICSVPFLLLEGFNPLFSICYFCLVTEYCFDFFNENLLILGSKFFIQLIELLLCIYAYYTSSEASQYCCDPIVSLYDLVVLEE